MLWSQQTINNKRGRLTPCWLPRGMFPAYGCQVIEQNTTLHLWTGAALQFSSPGVANWKTTTCDCIWQTNKQTHTLLYTHIHSFSLYSHINILYKYTHISLPLEWQSNHMSLQNHTQQILQKGELLALCTLTITENNEYISNSIIKSIS